MGFMAGKKALIVGVASDRSIASGIAEAFAREGAESAFTYQNDKLKGRVEKLAERLGQDTSLLFPCDVTSDEEIAAVFAAPAGATWDTINPEFPAHPIQAFSPGADSGTFDYFNEEIFEEADPSPILSAGVVEIVGEDDNLTVRGVADDGCTEGDLGSTCAAGCWPTAYFT